VGGGYVPGPCCCYSPSPLGPPFCSTRRTGVGARTENGGGHLAASCLGCGGCLYGEDGGGGLAASSWGFPWVRKLRVSSETAVDAASSCGLRVRKAWIEDGGGVLVPRCVVSLAFANRVCPARTAVVLAPPLLAYGCCGWACSRVCRQRRQRWGSRCVAFASRDGPGIRGG
jgi:hypothetical protein